jgi:hypothetical protein
MPNYIGCYQSHDCVYFRPKGDPKTKVKRLSSEKVKYLEISQVILAQLDFTFLLLKYSRQMFILTLLYITCYKTTYVE